MRKIVFLRTSWYSKIPLEQYRRMVLSKEYLEKYLEGMTVMKLFIDTANVAHIREANDWGVICGVTTNPSLIAKEGRDFIEVVREITSIVDGPISA